MWTQLIKVRLKPGKDDQIPVLLEQLKAAEQPGSGLVRTTALRDQNDPQQIFMIIVFDTEESARAREKDPRREKGLEAARATMADIFEGPPEFVDMTVIAENTW